MLRRWLDRSREHAMRHLGADQSGTCGVTVGPGHPSVGSALRAMIFSTSLFSAAARGQPA